LWTLDGAGDERVPRLGALVRTALQDEFARMIEQLDRVVSV